MPTPTTPTCFLITRRRRGGRSFSCGLTERSCDVAKKAQDQPEEHEDPDGLGARQVGVDFWVVGRGALRGVVVDGIVDVACVDRGKVGLAYGWVRLGKGSVGLR